jgi:hypothetical protein
MGKMDITKGIKQQLNSDIQRIISELSKTIVELKKDNHLAFDPVILKLEYLIRIWKSEEEQLEWNSSV